MSRPATLTPVIALLLAACAGGPPPEPPAPPPLDPTGVYDITVEAQGASIPGVLSIEGSAEAGYAGTVDTDMGGADFTSATVNGQEFTFNLPDVGIQVHLIFEGAGFTGGISGAMGDALIFGTKRSAEE